MSIAFISEIQDKKGRYNGFKVSFGVSSDSEEKTFYSKSKTVDNIIRDYMSAITFAVKTKHAELVTLSSSVYDMSYDMKDKIKFISFSYKGGQVPMIAPKDVDNQFQFNRYLAHNGIYDVPEGCISFMVIAFCDIGDEVVIQEFSTNYPIIDGNAILPVGKHERKALDRDFAYDVINSVRDKLKYSTEIWEVKNNFKHAFCMALNYKSNFSYMKQELKFYIESKFKKEAEMMRSELDFIEKCIKKEKEL